ncbi:MAG: hypothetical protein JW829_19825, partial [Pirellulales bacterium]|nr:hypothetical protein [Pirellulales bacterium]
STAGRGGGIYNSGTLTVTNSTISNNSASYSGGGIQMYGRASVSTLNNTIVAGNSASSGSDIYVGWAWLSGSYNLIGNGSDKSELVHGVDGNQVGTSSSPIDPLLSDAGRLLPGSPAINAGSNALAVDAQGNPFITDLDEQATRTDLEYMYHRVRDIPYMDLSTSREEMGMAYRTSKISLREITSPSKNFEDRADLETALEELTIESVFKSRGIIRV